MLLFKSVRSSSYSNMHEQACQLHCSSWPAQLCSSLPMVPNNFKLIPRTWRYRDISFPRQRPTPHWIAMTAVLMPEAYLHLVNRRCHHLSVLEGIWIPSSQQSLLIWFQLIICGSFVSRNTKVNLVYKSGEKGDIKEVVENPPKTYVCFLNSLKK